ncbi:protein downstream neighbor of son homolog [Phycodurus eques]|uniref:protein downstream neighbor of son homolog n=1 Tax=Phycodurus eques TaxID=693459 RepID=UPI002ACE8A20|nr:protein downstream neighbor of son homolog [Phycodurus eques]
MSEECGYSPGFKRPSEIMRMRRKRTRSEAFSKPSGDAEQSASSSACVRPFSPGPLFSNTRSRSGGVKRRNPFASIENRHSPRKKLFVYNDDDEGAGGRKPQRRTTRDDLAFSQLMDKVENRNDNRKGSSPSEDDSLFEESEEDVKTPLQKSPQGISPLSIAPPVCTEYPADWSLKTRLLFTSSLSLSWSEQPKAQEEALGLSQHCRAQFNTLPHNLQDPKSCTALRCAFQQSLIYWQHPSLSWVPLFPRINAERRFAGKNAPWAQDAELRRGLMSEWSASLSSLYSLLKARLCPYFYVCAYQFTVLFRAVGLGGSSSINALVSPTTRGLREAMQTEGIEFSLPLVEEERTASKSREQQIVCGEERQQKDSSEHGCCSDDPDGDDNDEDRGSSLSWLEEIGVQDKIKKPDSISIQLREEGRAVSVDHKPESVVCVEGPHTFTLVNFLINCKSVVAAAGTQAGLPPTLLAPVAFRGAAMHSLKARCVNVKSQVGSTYQNISSMEITGPVLPSSLHAITTLLRLAQKGNFSAVLYTHAPTAILNTHGTTCASGSADLSAFGLHPASIQQLQQPSSLGKTALAQITMNNYSYTWKK